MSSFVICGNLLLKVYDVVSTSVNCMRTLFMHCIVSKKTLFCIFDSCIPLLSYMCVILILSAAM